MNKNIWDKLDITKDSPNVLQLLNEQAELLSDKTRGLLIAEVNPVDTYDEKSFELGVVYNFYICAPYLGNFRTLLLTVIDISNKIRLIDRVNKTAPQDVAFEKLIDSIEVVISTSEVSKLISNLYSSSLEFKK